MKDALVFSAYCPDELFPRFYKYRNLIQKYFSDADVYIGLNGSNKGVQQMLRQDGFYAEVVPDHLITNSDNSGYQCALGLMKLMNKRYDTVYFSHTKSITHYHDFDDTLRYIEQEFYNLRPYIKSKLNNRVGSWSFYGSVGNGDGGQDTLNRYYDFKFTSSDVLYWLTSYAMTGDIVYQFLQNCSKDFFDIKYEDCGYNRYFFETYFPGVVSKMGKQPIFEHPYVTPENKENEWKRYNDAIDKWRRDNNI